MYEWIARWWVEAAMGIIISALTLSFHSLRRKTKLAVAENTALKAGIKALLRDRIVQAYNHYREKGCWPIYARESVMGMYEQYQVLGGNGVITGLLEALKDLPTN